jgi:predicted dehydrogenase
VVPVTRLLNAAVVGLGVGEQHARAYLADPRAQLRWLHDLDGERTGQVLARLGQGKPAESFAQILADPALDLVSLATYDNLHAAEVVAALEAGKHVFCEKPLCETPRELADIRQALSRHAGCKLACNLVLRAAPLYVWLRAAIRDGELGEIYAIDADYLYGRVHKITEGWRGEIQDYSVFTGGGIHMLDLVMWLTGQRPGEVSAVGNQIVTRGTRFQHPDYVAATYRFPSGLVARVTANFGCVHRHQHVLRVFGTRATFIYDDAGARLHEQRDPGGPPRIPPQAPLPASKGDLIPGFLTQILADQAGDTQHEFDLMSACLAGDAALAAKQTLAIEYSS